MIETKVTIITKALPVGHHHIGGDHKLQASNIFNSKIVKKPNKANNQSDQETKQPLHEHILKYLHLSTTPPILFKELILSNPIKGDKKKKFKNLSQINLKKRKVMKR